MYVTFYGSNVSQNLVLQVEGNDSDEAVSFVSNALNIASQHLLSISVQTEKGFYLLKPSHYPITFIGKHVKADAGPLIIGLDFEQISRSLRAACGFLLQDVQG